MPRPKQSRAARIAQAGGIAAQQTRQDSVSSDLYGHSDREQERIRDNQQKRALISTSSKPRRSSSRARATATGGHGLARAADRRDAAISRLQDSDVVTSSSDRVEIPGHRVGDLSTLGRSRSAVATTPLHLLHATEAERELDSYGDIDNSFDLSLSADEGDDATTIQREEATRGRSLHNTSVVDSSQLHRRRPRSSSIIGPGDVPIRPSSRGVSRTRVSTAFNIGAFRRRPREPSILATARKRRSEEGEDSDGSEGSVYKDDGVGSENQGKGDSRESNEPGLEHQHSRQSRTPKARGSDLDANSDTPEESIQLGNSSAKPRGRKRKSTSSPMTNHRPEKSIRVSEQHRQICDEDSIMEDRDVVGAQAVQPSTAKSVRSIVVEDDDDDSLSDISSIASPLSPPPLPSLRDRPMTPTREDPEIVAPPQSSEDDGGEGLILPDVHALAKRRRRPSHSSPLRYRNSVDSELSSPPSLTHSPNIRPDKKASAHKGRTVRQKQASPKLNTAELASLLPKRANRRGATGRTNGNDDHDEGEDGQNEEIDMSALGPDDDELSHADSRVNHRSMRPGARNLPKSRNKPLPSKLTQKLKQAQGGSRTNGKRSGKQAGSSRTYGSRRASDKENVDGGEGENPNEDGTAPDESFADTTMAESSQGEELRNAISKFKEVDKWQLEFEDAVSSPSQSDAR